jgi:hypothetical protein
MPDLVQLLAIAIGVLLLALVLELVRRRLLGEEYAIVWIAGALALLALAIWRRALDTVARWLGIHYGPALLLLLLGLIVFVALLFFSMVVSRQRVQIERLIEDVAILDARLRDVRRDSAQSSTPESTSETRREHEDPPRHP